MLLTGYRIQPNMNQGEMMDKFQQTVKSGAHKASTFKPGAMIIAATAAAALSYPCHAQSADPAPAKTTAAKAPAAPATPVCVGEMAKSASLRVAEEAVSFLRFQFEIDAFLTLAIVDASKLCLI